MQTQNECLFHEISMLIDLLKTRTKIMHPAVCSILDAESIDRDIQIAAASLKNANERLGEAWELARNLNGFESENPRDWA